VHVGPAPLSVVTTKQTLYVLFEPKGDCRKERKEEKIVKNEIV